MHGIQEIDSAELSSWLASGEKIRLVDVRSAAELRQGIIEGADFIPMHMVPLRVNEFEGEEKVVFYCRSGARSGQVCSFLQQRGITNIYNLAHGVIGWAHAGLTLVAPEPRMVAG